MLVIFPDDTTVRARGRLDLVPDEQTRPPDFAVYLDERWAVDPEVTWPFRVVAWPDFELPDDEGEMFDAVQEVHRRARAGELVEIACYGGLGRTGTFLACLAVAAGVDPGNAVAWVRAQYDQRAVETDAQVEIVARFSQP